MPCTTGQECDRTDYEARRENERLTRVSCDIMRVLQSNGFDLSQLGGETRQWWDRHQAQDTARAAAAQQMAERDSLRESALAKLSPAERKALGL